MYRNLFLALAALMFVSWRMSVDAYRSVPPSELLPAVKGEPLQTELLSGDAAPGCARDGYSWSFEPLYRYDITGYVFGVSHKLASELKGVMAADLGLLWGENARDGLYRHTKLRVRMDWFVASWKNGYHFNTDAAANTHIVTCDPGVYEKIRSVRMGDQVRLRGLLVGVNISRGGGAQRMTARSSVSRTDTRGGACEILYIAGPGDIEILRRGPFVWSMLMKLSGAGLIILLIAWALELRRRVKKEMDEAAKNDF
ncbi:MAG TPA: hypothetical protein DDW67_06260 [Elusimicrobia bacterium]|nr:hypothetical protein [Elusimicrobiota bacterium]